MTLSDNYVLTGAPCAGKTTVVNELAALGYNTVPEIARVELEQKKLDYGVDDPKEITDEIGIQTHITERRIVAEELNGIFSNDITVLDRSLVDTLVYREHLDSPSPHYLDEIIEDRYDVVFFLESLELEKDGIRREDEEEQEEIGTKLWQKYGELGIERYHIPLVDIDERVKTIKETIEGLSHR